MSAPAQRPEVPLPDRTSPDRRPGRLLERGVSGKPASLRLLLLYETLAPDYMGGIETRNLAMARALAARGHHVTMAGYGAPAATDAPAGVERLSLGNPRGLYTAAGRRSTRRALGFAWAVRRIPLAPYDLVETANMPYAHVPGLAARCRAAGKPLAVTWYEHWGAYWRDYVGVASAPFYRLAEGVVSRLGDAALAISELTRERVAAQRRGPVEVLPCGVDLEAVERAAAAGAANPRAPLVFAGRLLAHKRVDLLLAAVARLPPTPNAGPQLSVFGDGPERPRLEALAARLGVAGRVRFEGHVESIERVWQALGGALVAVQPSAREGFGLFPLEAMAAGVPVVHCESAESAVDELVRHGVDGLRVPDDDAALAGALAALLADPVRRGALAAAARARAAAFSWSALAARFERWALELLEAGSRGAARLPARAPR
jgi:glycosyltransferase involved in cell wall biosynthesis